MERYEFSEGSSDKFWEVEVSGCDLTVRYGRIGTQGQSKEKTFASAEAAEKEKAKLVKEKTGKGYTLVGGGASVAPTAAPAAASAPATPKAAPRKKAAAAEQEAPTVSAPAVAEEAASIIKSQASIPVQDDGIRLLQGTPLPTRTRPGSPLGYSPQDAWQSICEGISLLVNDEDARKQSKLLHNANQYHSNTTVFKAILTTPLAGLPLEQAVRWFRVFEECFGPRMGWSREDEDCSLYMNFMQQFAYALIGENGTVYAMKLIALLDNNPQRSGYIQQAWAMASLIALRQVLVLTSDADYQAALDWALGERELNPGQEPKRETYYSFVLADDRADQHHPLQAAQVLQAAADRGQDISNEVAYLPLLAEVIADVPAAWRKKRDYHFYFSYSRLAPENIVATVMASAAAQNASPVPMLDLLLSFASEKDRTTLACGLLDTRSSEALSLLLSMAHDKFIRAALDKGLAALPRWMFRELLAAYSPNRSEPTIKIRLMQLCTQYEPDTLREWVADFSERSRATLDNLLAIDACIATEAELPRVLQSPPWHRAKRKNSDDIVLALQAINTPFVMGMSAQDLEDRLKRAKGRITWDGINQLTTVPAVVAKITELEAKLQKELVARRKNIPALDEPMPLRTANEAEVADWMSKRLRLVMKHSDDWPSYNNPYDRFTYAVLFMPEVISLAVWEMPDVMRSSYHLADSVAMFARFGERALPGFLGLLGRAPVDMLPTALNVEASAIAPYVAHAFSQLKKARGDAMAWLKKYPRAAAFGLIPDAVGKIGAARDAAEVSLRWMQANIPAAGEVIQEAIAAYTQQDASVPEAVQQVLERDPLEQVPSKIPKLPAWYVPANLTRPRLKNGAALPDGSMMAVGEMLAFSNPESPYEGLAMLRESCEAASLSNYAWDVFSVWLTEGGVGKENWALRVLGWFGNDDIARRLTPLIRKWPGEAAHARAVLGLDVLAAIGSDVALMHLNGIAEKLKFKGLQEKAREKIAALAEARDLTPEELADRLVPDFDLDERGGLDLDFGARRFRVGFDEFLKPWVKDESGARLKDLPKPNKSDNAELAAEASTRWSSLKKDARAIASLQLTRLETLLSSGRRIKPAVFDTFFARHPLIRNLAQRLVWGVYADGVTQDAPGVLFRITEDLVCADMNDDEVQVDFSEEATTAIGLVHPLHMTEEQKAAWGTLFGDYEIAQPFAQLGRDTYALREDETALTVLKRFEGRKVESKRLRGIASRGWRLGDPQDGGGIWWIQRKIRLINGHQALAVLEFGDGLIAGGMEYEEEFQTLGELKLEEEYSYWRGNVTSHPFSSLDKVTASEILRDLTQLADAAKVR